MLFVAFVVNVYWEFNFQFEIFTMYVHDPNLPERVLPKRIYRRAFDLCIPLNVTFEINLLCNIRCKHCYNFDRDQPPPMDRIKQELSANEICRIIDEVRDAGCLYLSLSGGEAILHPGIYDFIRHARSRSLSVTLLTNGTLLDNPTCKKLIDSDVTAVKISLYGASPATHDAFTQVPGSFARSIEGARHLKSNHVPVWFSFCVVKDNAHEVEDMFSVSKDLGIQCMFDTTITPRNDGNTDPMAHRMDRETLKKLHEGPFRQYLNSPDLNPKRSVQCGCARTNCGISSTGNVYPCIAAPLPSGNLKTQSFSEIWEKSPELNRIRNLTLSDFKTCEPCPHRPYCRRSSGAVYSSTGDYTGAEEFACMEAEVIHEIMDQI